MKIFLPVLILAFCPCTLLGNELSATAELKGLDKAVEHKERFEKEKLDRIRQLSRELTGQGLAAPGRYGLCEALCNEYQSFKYDSAYVYSQRMLASALQMGDGAKIAESKIAVANSCISAGLYKEAFEVANSIDTVSIDDAARTSLYSLFSTMYMEMAIFVHADPFLDDYRSKSRHYTQRVLAMAGPGQNVILEKLRMCQLNEDYDQLISLAEAYLSSNTEKTRLRAMVASLLGFAYRTKGDDTKAIVHFTHAAILDLEMSIKETAAIRQLAEILFSMGDVERAYEYANIALSDANFYNARHRKIEIGNVLPIIDSGRFDIIKRQKNQLWVYFIVSSMLFIVVLLAAILIFNQMKKLAAARLVILQKNDELSNRNGELLSSQQQIGRQNEELHRTNNKLVEANRIKDEYIGYFFSINSTYIEKIEHLHKMVVKKVRNRQLDDLLQLSDSPELQMERENMYVLFDQTFIKLFPDFVARYNQLFQEEDRIVLKHESILNAELRIFALIRLGVTETERIAKFLNYSVHTVNNYKTKAKNRSLVSNDQFETKIMEIESVKVDL
ncbi:MAG: DUF6377 domain-containing protein [Breznakibacter sp.]